MKNVNKKQGFTLTELIIVIVIIGILAAVLIPNLVRYVERAKESNAREEARLALQDYNLLAIEAEDKVMTQENFESEFNKNDFILGFILSSANSITDPTVLDKGNLIVATATTGAGDFTIVNAYFLATNGKRLEWNDTTGWQVVTTWTAPNHSA